MAKVISRDRFFSKLGKYTQAEQDFAEEYDESEKAIREKIESYRNMARSAEQAVFNNAQERKLDEASNINQAQLNIENSTPRNSMEEEIAYAKEKVGSLSTEEQSWLDKLNTYVRDREAITMNVALAGGDPLSQVMAQQAIEGERVQAESAKKNLEKTGKDYSKYSQYVNEIKDAEEREKEKKDIEESLNTGDSKKDALNAAFYTAYDIALSPVAGGAAMLENLNRRNYADQNAPLNTNSSLYMMQNLSSDIEEGVSNRIDNKVGQFAYGVGVSTGKAGLSMAMAGGVVGELGLTGKAANVVADLVTLPQFGSSAYATTLQNAQERGLTHEQAQQLAVTSGAAEMIFEKVSLDHFWDIAKNSGKAATRKALVNVLAQSGIEGSEEVFTSLANAIADNLISGDKSEYNNSVKSYQDEGYSEDEAKKKATMDFIANLGIDFAGGAISGGIFGAVGSVGNSINVHNNANIAYGVSDNGKEKYTGKEVADKYAQVRDLFPEEGNTPGQTNVANQFKQDADLYRIKAQNDMDVSQKARNDLYRKQSYLEEQYETDDKYRQIVDEYRAQKSEENKAAASEMISNTLSTLNNAPNIEEAPGTIVEEKTVSANLEELNNSNLEEADSETTAEEKPVSTNLEELDNSIFDEVEIPSEMRQSNNISADEALENIGRSTNAEELTRAYNDAKNSENISEKDMEVVDNQLNLKKNLLNVELNPTTEDAYAAGVRGEEFTPSNAEEERAYNQGEIYRENRVQSEKNPKTATIIADNGDRFTMDSIRMEDGEPIVTSTDGKEYNLGDVRFAHSNAQDIVNNSLQYNNPQAYLDGYNPYFGAERYEDAIKNVYNYARLTGPHGTLEKAIKTTKGLNIDNKTLETFYNEGLKEFVPEKSTKRTSAKKAEGKVIDKDKRLSKSQTKALKAVAKAMNLDVVVSSEGMETKDGHIINGFFSEKDNQITLNPNAKDIYKTLIHEAFGELSEVYAPEEMDELQAAIIEYNLEKRPSDFNKTVDSYHQVYVNHEGAKSYREAANEYVNDLLVELFADEEGVKEFANFISDRPKSVMDRFIDLIDSIIDGLKKLMGANHDMFKNDVESLKRLRKMALDTFSAARENKLNATEELQNASSVDVRNSIDTDSNGRKLSDEQKKYFRNTKVVDGRGRLLVVYHGTEEKFNAFKANEFIKENDGVSRIKGYFSESEEYANRYGNTTPYYLNITNPLVMDGEAKTIDGWNKFFNENGITDVVYDSSVTGKNYPKDTLKGGNYQDGTYYTYFELMDESGVWYGDGNLTGRIEAAGYDGIQTNDEFEKAWMPFNSNAIKRTDNLNPSQNNDTRYSIDVDTTGRELSEGQKEFFKDSKIRDAEGRLKVMYHGTEMADFTVFNTEYSDDGISIFFTDNETVAKGYSGTRDKVKFNYTLDDLNKMVDGYERIIKDGDTYKLQEYFPAKDKYETSFEGTFDEMKDYIVEMYGETGSGNYEVYLNVTNPYVVDAENSYWDEIPHGDETWTTREYAEYAKNNGYDGLIVNDVIDTAVYASNMEKFEPSQIVVAFNSNQVKSVENEHPTENEDIRYSIDTAYNEAYERADIETMQKMVDAAAKENGFDSPKLYHGTGHFGFTQMDLSKMDDKRSIFLTNNPNIAATYSGTTQQKMVSEGFNEDVFSIPTNELADRLNENKPDDGIDRNYEYYNRERLEDLKNEIFNGISDMADIIDNIKATDERDEKVIKRIKNTMAIFPAEDLITNPNSKIGVDLWYLSKKPLEGTEEGKRLEELESNIRRYNTINDEMRDTNSDEIIVEDMLDGYSVEAYDPKSAAVFLRKQAGQGIYSLYAKLGKTLEIDGKGRFWNSLHNWSEAYTNTFTTDNTHVDRIGNMAYIFSDNGENLVGMELNDFNSDFEDFVIQKMLLNKVGETYRIKLQGYTTTRDIAGFARQHGFDSVIFRNIKDNGGRNDKIDNNETADVYTIFNPNKVKSADPVTYDDRGEVIPLSERFNDQENELRYSIDVEGFTDDGDKLYLTEPKELSTEDWTIIAKEANKLGYEIGTAKDAKEVYTNLAENSKKYGRKEGMVFNDDLAKALRKAYGDEVEEEAPKYSEEEAKKIAKEAEELFGTTNNFNLAGYLDVNGKLIDFSEGQGYRVQDHREIGEVLDLPDDAGYSDSLIEFMNMGNIRLQTYGIDISVVPNKAQKSMLRDFFNSLGGEVTVDYSRKDGMTAGTTEYQEGTASSRILNDIDSYFESGEVPKGTARFSIEVLRDKAKRYDIDYDLLDVLDNPTYDMVTDDTMSQILDSVNELFRGQNVDEATIQNVAKDIKEYADSNIKQSFLEQEMKSLFTWMQNASGVDAHETFNMFKVVAKEIVDEAKTESIDDEFRKYVKGVRISLSDNQKNEVANTFGSYDAFRKAYFGTLTLANDGAPLDSVWSEIVEQSGGGLRLDVSDADQPLMLADYLDALKPQPVNNYGANKDEVATDLAIRILEKYYAAEQQALTNSEKEKALKESNPEIKQTIERARADMRKAELEYRKQVKAEYDAREAELIKELSGAESVARMYNRQYRDLQNKVDAGAITSKEDKEEIKKLKDTLSRKEKALAKAQAKAKAPLTAYQEQLGRKEEKRKITQLSNRLMKMVYAPTEKLHMMEELRKPVGEFLSGIDFISHRAEQESLGSIRWQTKMDNLRQYLEKADELGMGNVAELLEDDLITDMANFTAKHSEVNKISRMSKEDLHDLYMIMTRLSSTVSKANQTFANSVYSDIDKLNEDSLAEMATLNSNNVGNGVMQTIKDFFGKTLEDPITYFELLGNAPKTIYDGFLKGFDKRTADIKEAQEYMSSVLPEGTYTWEEDKHVFKIQDRELELSTAQIMTLYELNKRKAAKLHLYSGGIKGLYNGKLGYTRTSDTAYHLIDSDYDNIFGVLTDEQKEIADKMQEFMSANCADWGNDVSMTLWGYKKFTEKDYFPMSVDSDSRNTSNRDTNVPNLYANKNMSSSKELNEFADNPLLIGSIFDVFTDHVADMATYHGMVLPQMDAMRWFNFRKKSVDPAGRNYIVGTKQSINRIYGKAGTQYFTNLMLGINGTEPKARGIRINNVLIGRYKKVAVTAKVRVAIQQPTSYVRALDEMEGKYLTKALATTNPIEYSKKAKEKSMLAWWKGQGYYEAYLGKGLKEILVGKNPIQQKVEDFEGWGAQTADDLTWGVLYHACELEIQDKTDLKGKAFDDAVVERFEDLVSKTQVVDTMLHRTDIMRSQADLVKIATSFMTEPLKTYNMLLRSIVGATRDKKYNKLIRTLFVYLLNSAILSMVTTTWDAFRKDDDETKYSERWLKMYGEEFVDNLNPANMIPFVKDVVDVVSSKLSGEYSNATDMTYDGISKFAQFFYHIGKRVTGGDLTQTDYGLAKEAAQALSILSGVPVYNVWNDIEGIHNGFFDNWETKKQSSYNKFYKAIDNGDDLTQIIDELHEEGKEDKAIKSQITSHYKQTYLDTTDMTEKANLKNSLIKAYMAAGDSRAEAIKKINKW